MFFCPAGMKDCVPFQPAQSDLKLNEWISISHHGIRPPLWPREGTRGRPLESGRLQGSQIINIQTTWSIQRIDLIDSIERWLYWSCKLQTKIENDNIEIPDEIENPPAEGDDKEISENEQEKSDHGSEPDAEV